MEILILIPLALLAMLLYAVIAVTRLRGRVRRLDEELYRLRTDLLALQPRPPTSAGDAELTGPAASQVLRRQQEHPVPGQAGPLTPPSVAPWSRPMQAPEPSTAPSLPKPPVPAVVSARVEPVSPGSEAVTGRAAPSAGPPKTPAAPAPAAAEASVPEPVRGLFSLAGVNLEQFMGVKLFAWIGGLALFLGAAFFVKHSFEQGWVSPQLRVTAGFITGLGLLVGGVWLRRKEYSVTSHTLCGAGVVILYTSSFAAHAYYQLIGSGASFVLMSLVTITAFLVADRLRAVPVAVLGILGGFLTPPLLATGVDRPFGLFGYVALLDAALVAVALRRRWHYLVVLGAAGTVLMQVGWAGKFFAVEKAVTALGIFATFNLLFLGALAVAGRLKRTDGWITGPALAMPFVTFVFTGWLLTFRELGARPEVLFSFLLLADLCVIAIVVMDAQQQVAHLAAGAAVFLLLGAWTTAHLVSGLLNWALVGYLGFALLHTLFPWLLHRQQPGTGVLWQAHLFPPLALILAMLPMFRTIELTWLIWPLLLLVDVLAIGLAVFSGVVLTVLAVLVLTVVATAFWLLHAPAEVTVMPEFLVVVGLFAVFFFAVSLALGRLPRPAAAGSGEAWLNGPAWLRGLEGRASPDTWRDLLPATSAILPFLLLIMAVGRLPLVNPTPLFGLALVLVAMLLALARLLRVDVLAPVALGCVLALEFVWHNTRFTLGAAGLTLSWYVGFAALFMAYPFGFRSVFAGRILPWAASASSGPLHFYLVYRVVKMAWPNELMGFLPATFAVPMLGALAFILKAMPVEGEGRMRLLAWFGGSALFFITLIFPIQFDRQWITLGWALEGAALLWLFHRVPHPGLRGLGFVLLGVAFIRLALNPAVLEYHPRSATPVLNWFLYSYGVVIACLLGGARLLAPPRDRVFHLNAPPILYTLAGVLGFLLLNIEIADGFSTGANLTFDFNASLGQNMTYSLAWGLYALGLLVLGFRFQSAGARYAGMGLLVVTLLKLFLADLWQLGGLYRVGSLIGLAMVLMVVSFAYQRFFGFPGRGAPGPAAATGVSGRTESSRSDPTNT